MVVGHDFCDLIAIQTTSLGAYITLRVANRYATALVDSGSQCSFLSPEHAHNISLIRRCEPLRVRMGNGVITEVNRIIECEVTIQKLTCKHDFYLLDGCLVDCILGFDSQQKHRCYARPDKLAFITPCGDEIPFLPRSWKRFLHIAAAQATPETHFSPQVKAQEHKGITDAPIGPDLNSEQKEALFKILCEHIH